MSIRIVSFLCLGIFVACDGPLDDASTHHSDHADIITTTGGLGDDPAQDSAEASAEDPEPQDTFHFEGEASISPFAARSDCERTGNCAKDWKNKDVTVRLCALDQAHAKRYAHLHLREGITEMVSDECKLGCAAKSGCTHGCYEAWSQTGAHRATTPWSCSQVAGECEHPKKEMYECKRRYSWVYGNVFCKCRKS